MFGLGLWEIVIIAIVAVVLIRPQDLPKIIRRLGRAYGMLTRLKESALQTARELESEINKFEVARDPAPGGNGNGRGDRPDEAEPGERGRLADEADELYRRLREENPEEDASPKEHGGRGKREARSTRAAKRKPDVQGGTGRS